MERGWHVVRTGTDWRGYPIVKQWEVRQCCVVTPPENMWQHLKMLPASEKPVLHIPPPPVRCELDGLKCEICDMFICGRHKNKLSYRWICFHHTKEAARDFKRQVWDF